MVRRFVFVTAALLLATGAPSPAAGQSGKLAGIVTDAATGQPLSGVQVTVVGTGRTVLTQENGRYFFINIPAGTYSVTAQLLGYATVRRENVQISIDVTRTLDFQLTTEALALQQVVVEAERVPLIQLDATGSAATITGEAIQALPVTDIRGALSLQPGFLDLSLDNEDAVSYVDSRRGFTPVRIRGGRTGETATLVDGIPVANIVFGGPAFDVPSMAVEQLNLVKGGFEAQYGNALSGVINTATREGSETLHGSMRYSTSRLPGAMGSRQDELRGLDIVEAFVSGPVPGTDRKLRYVLAGQFSNQADRVLEYDDHVFDPIRTTFDENRNRAYQWDLFKGWRSFGFNQARDLYGKLTYAVTPAAKLNFGVMTSARKRQPYDWMHQFLGVDLGKQCQAMYPESAEWCDRYFGTGWGERLEDIITGNQTATWGYNQYVVRNAISTERDLVWAKWDHTIGRTFYRAIVGRFRTERLSCNWYGGVCIEDKIRTMTTIGPLGTGQFTTQSRHGAPHTGPTMGAENFFGSDSTRSWVARVDVQSQVTDHHNLQAGLFFQQHELFMNESRNLAWPFDRYEIARYEYQSRPWDAAFYIQDKIEYDFLTVNLGLRFDYSRADGLFFTDPLDPTNGTTAFEVCEGKAPSLGQTTPWVARGEDGEPLPFTGIAACSFDAALMDSARAIAFKDDFSEAPIRKQFSPRIGVSFPIMENARVFANYGQYSQLPTYHAMFQRTGIGRRAEQDVVDPVKRIRTEQGALVPDTIRKGALLEGTALGPDLRPWGNAAPLIGNPRLESERTSLYELGIMAELFTDYALSIVGFYKDQSGLTGIRRGGVRPTGERVNDPGETYGSTSPEYQILVNADYQTVRGVDVSFRRRVRNNWGFDINYGFMQAWTNAAPPELQLQRLYEGDREAFKEVRSEVDQPHILTGVLRFAMGADAPEGRLGDLLRHSSLAITASLASGLPYTPTTNFLGTSRLERNSGRAPTTFTTNVQATKEFRIANIRYGAFLRITNLFDTKNCMTVFQSTGQCDTGSLASVRLFPSAAPGTAASYPETGYLTTHMDRPHMMAGRRHITTGLQISF